MKTAKTLFGVLTITMALLAQAQAQDFLTNGLVAYYPFNGNANDESGNGNDGIVNGTSLAPDRFGLPNRTYSFDGVTNFITIPHDAIFESTDVTVSMWFNCARFPDSTEHDHEAAMLISKGRNICELHLGCPPFVNTGIRFLPRQENGVSWVLDARSADFHINVWYHVVATWHEAGHTSHIFLNGHELALTDISGPDAPDNTSPARLGMRYNGPGGTNSAVVPGGIPFQGVLDDVRIYDRALSASEVHQLYVYERGPAVNLLKAVKPSFSGLALGTNYQLQVSGDLSAWTNQGSPFAATNTSMIYPQYWDVDNWNQLFFRLQVAP